jgi:hypothetical protein
MYTLKIKRYDKKLITLLLVVMTFFSGYGQHFMPGFINQAQSKKLNPDLPPPPEITISYNEKIVFDPYMVDGFDSISWTILGENDFTYSGENLQQLKNYTFSIPGNYTIHFQTGNIHPIEPLNSCNHTICSNIINLTVTKYKLTFLKESVVLSETINAGIETTGIQLTVNVKLDSYDGTGIGYDYPLTTSGVSTTISGTLNQPVQLNPGINTVTYQLSGKVHFSNTYISFDFTDNIKGIIWTYSLMNSII